MPTQLQKIQKNTIFSLNLAKCNVFARGGIRNEVFSDTAVSAQSMSRVSSHKNKLENQEIDALHGWEEDDHQYNQHSQDDFLVVVGPE